MQKELRIYRPPIQTNCNETLVAAINRGDKKAFEALYHRHKDWVARLAYRFTGNQEDALEVLQETFVYLLGKFPGFHLTARMKTFLYPVVKNTALAIRRKSQRFQSEVSPQVELLPCVTYDPHSNPTELVAVLSSLTDAQREVLLMRFVDDMTFLEIAEALHIPLGTAKSRVHNALATLRDDPRTRAYFEP